MGDQPRLLRFKFLVLAHPSEAESARGAVNAADRGTMRTDLGPSTLAENGCETKKVRRAARRAVIEDELHSLVKPLYTITDINGL